MAYFVITIFIVIDLKKQLQMEKMYSQNEGDVVSRTAYASHYTGDCMSHAYDIKIKGCTGFLVYYLVPTTTCSSAYCFGKKTYMLF